MKVRTLEQVKEQMLTAVASFQMDAMETANRIASRSNPERAQVYRNAYIKTCKHMANVLMIQLLQLELESTESNVSI